MIQNVYIARIAVFLCASFLTGHAAAARIATFQSFVIGQGTAAELNAEEIAINPIFSITYPSELSLFLSESFSGSDVGLTLSWTADASNEPDFTQIAALLTNGVDDEIGLWSAVIDGGGFAGNIYNESVWLAEYLAPGEVDLSGYTVTAIVMTVTDISFIPWDGEFTWLRWGSISYDVIGHPVPVPATLFLLASALGVLVRGGPNKGAC